MYELLKIWLELRFDRRAVTSLEYGIIAAIIVVVGLVGVSGVGTGVGAKMSKVRAAMT